jgi:hypothetical protein
MRQSIAKSETKQAKHEVVIKCLNKLVKTIELNYGNGRGETQELYPVAGACVHMNSLI